MSTQTLLQKSKPVPFTLNFVEGIDKTMYDEEISNSETIAQSYDPITQTSNISIYAGTSLTYDSTSSGLFMTTDDNEQSDT